MSSHIPRRDEYGMLVCDVCTAEEGRTVDGETVFMYWGEGSCPGYQVDASEERTHYREAAQLNLWAKSPGNPQRLAPAEASRLAADGAVCADRFRMAAALRERIMHSQRDDAFDPALKMKMDAVMFDLADQIETGMLRIDPDFNNKQEDVDSN